MNLKTPFTSLAVALFTASQALAHPGHGDHAPNTVQHYVLSPEHWVTILGTAVVLGWAAYRFWAIKHPHRSKS
ncbi:MAG: hypothetical protein MUC97_19250 [Bernardetiaceae bacterium]|jgi:hypothetical protein|nr:hypothetical protein [Bernardetiaceae bacterium]